MTTVALKWEEVPENLPLVIAVGNSEMDLRKKALRAGTDETLKLGARAFHRGSAHPVPLYASVIDSPRGEFALFDGGRFWDSEMQRGTHREQIALFADVCRRASSVIFDWVGDVDQTRSAASMAAAFGVPHGGIWIDALPTDPEPEAREASTKRLAKPIFGSKLEVRRGDLREIADCRCGKAKCEQCGPWLELLDHVLAPRPEPKPLPFRILVEEVTGWGIKPNTRIARGVQVGSVKPGDEIEILAAGEEYLTEVEDVARGGVVFTLRGPKSEEIDALAKPGSLEVRSVVTADAIGEPTENSGEAFVDGAHAGRVRVGTDGRKMMLRFADLTPFRRGDVVTVFFGEREHGSPLLADSYVIR